MSKKQEKVDIEALPLYSNPSLIIAGDKAKFYYDKEQKDVVMVEIISVVEGNGGFLISWFMSHDKDKSFRTFVRKGETIEQGEWVIGTTITAKMVRSIQLNSKR